MAKKPQEEPEEYTEDTETQGISQYEYENQAEYGDNIEDYNTEIDNSAEKTKLLIETDSYINRIQLTLENKYLETRTIVTENEKEEIIKELRQIPDTEPLANNFGISQIMGHIKGKISHVTILSNLQNDTFQIFMGRFIKDFSRQVIAHEKDWGIKQQNLRDVRRIVIDGVYLALTRAIQDKERGYNWNPNAITQKEQIRQGVFNNVFNKFGRRNQY